jgi:hypothetical protein
MRLQKIKRALKIIAIIAAVGLVIIEEIEKR